MKTFQNLSEFWQTYFDKISLHQSLDEWTIVFIAYDAGDLLVSLANPFTEVHDEVFIKHVSEADVATFVSHYKLRFINGLPLRFNFYRPEVKKVLTEYPDWQTFYDAWINDSAALLQGNMPLLFDYPSQDQYRAMQLQGSDYAGYRRLLIVLYQYRKQQFKLVFIKGVTDDEFAAIRARINKLCVALLPRLIINES